MKYTVNDIVAKRDKWTAERKEKPWVVYMTKENRAYLLAHWGEGGKLFGVSLEVGNDSDNEKELVHA